jgi:signal transduction histidine kinase
MLEARGDVQRAIRAFRRIPVGTRHANGLPFDVLVPYRLYWLQQPVVDVLFAQLSRPDVSVAYRKLLLEKLQVSPYLQERATKVLARIQSEMKAMRALQRAPAVGWRRQCFRGRDGVLFWQKGRRGLWWVAGGHLKGVVSSLWRSWSPAERATVQFSLLGFGEGCASKSSGQVPAAAWWMHSARQIGAGPVVLSFRRVDWWGPWTLAFVWVGLLCVLALMLLGGESLRRLWQKEQQLHHQQTLFSAAVAHELRTPLTSLALTTEMLVSEALPAEKLPRYHRRLAEQVERLQGVVANVIAYHRGSFAEVVGEPVSLVDVVNEAMVATDAKAQRVGCTLALVVQGEPSACVVRVGRTGLLRVVINIVDNACKYAPGTSVVLTVGPGARLSVRDGGPGIPDDVLPLVFAPFVQGKRPEGGGLGLGLALVKEIVSHSGGSCQMRNHPEGGAECTLVWEA